jgi:iron complex outermembrane receptor protein
MKKSHSRKRAGAWRSPYPLKFVCSLFIVTAGMADAADTLAQTTTGSTPVVVTATRIWEGLNASSTTIIDSEDLERLPLSTLPEILEVEAGVQTRDLFGGTAGSRATVDLRGFGAPAKSNTLILLNGRRLNDIDLAAIDYANIPRDSIDRIEIIRGNAGAVLYGDGAVGGVINIVTKESALQKTSYGADAALGSDVYREANLSAVQNIGAFSVNAYGSYIDGDGYRDNNDILQRNLVAELHHNGDYGDAFVKLNLDSQRLGLPGARLVTLTSNLFETDPRGATNPLDFGFQNGIGATVGLTRQIAGNTELIIDAGMRRKDQDAGFFIGSGFPSHVDTVLSTWSFTPRATTDHKIAGMMAQTKYGADFYYSDYNSDRQQRPGNAPQHRYDAEQYSAALYGQTTVRINKYVTAVAGGRIQRIDASAGDIFDPTAPGAFGSGKNSFSDTEYQYALNFGVDVTLSDVLALFARGGRSFRLPTLDERISNEDATSFDLKTQTGEEIEAGARIRIDRVSLESSIFLAETDNEIRFNPTLGGGFGTNSNFGPIRRYGWENTATADLTKDLQLKFNLTLIKAKFQNGVFEGKDVPLVSDITAAAVINYRVNDYVRVSGLVNYIGERWLENDEANTFPKTPDHVLVGFKVSGDVGSAFWSATINNLLDEDYFNYGVASTTTAGTFNTFPQPGRTFLIRAGVKL